MLLSAPYLMFFFFFFGKRETHSCSTSAFINLSMVSIVDSSLSTLHVSANRILRCEANAYFIGSGYASLRTADTFPGRSFSPYLATTGNASAVRRLGYAGSLSFFFNSRAAALVSRVLRLRRSTLARACTPLKREVARSLDHLPHCRQYQRSETIQCPGLRNGELVFTY